MMTEEEILKIFADTGALLEGHFELRSKLHSDRYFQCANVLRYPRIAARLCDELVAKMKAACDIGAIDGVISPAVGGILVGHEVARALDTKCVFAEKVQAGDEVDATGEEGGGTGVTETVKSDGLDTGALASDGKGALS